MLSEATDYYIYVCVHIYIYKYIESRLVHTLIYVYCTSRKHL